MCKRANLSQVYAQLKLYFTVKHDLSSLANILIVTRYTLFQSREVMLYGVAQWYAVFIFTQKISSVLEYAPHPTQATQRLF